jgi:tetratricopeptide (TPR) repeat protein
MRRPFISYVRESESTDFAARLYRTLKQQEPSFRPWMDKFDLLLGDSYFRQVGKVIERCDGLIFVWSRHESEDCDTELKYARDYGKLIIPLQIHVDATRLYLLKSLPSVDFTQGWTSGIAKLLEALSQLAAPLGRILAIDKELRQGKQALRRLPEEQRVVAKRKIAILETQRAALQRAMDAEAVAHSGSEASVEAGIDETLRAAASPARSAPRELRLLSFRNRESELSALEGYLERDEIRVILVTGEEGIGKTRLVRQLLDELRHGQLAYVADRIVSRRVHRVQSFTATDLLAELRDALPEKAAAEVGPLLARPGLTLIEKLRALIIRLGGTRVVVAIDGAENLLDEKTSRILDADLAEALEELASRSNHRIRVILVSRTAAEPLRTNLPGSVVELRVMTGLSSEDLRVLLTQLDPEDSFGLSSVPDPLMRRVHQVAAGRPRAVELMFGNLAVERAKYLSLEQLVDQIERNRVSPERTLDFLVSEMVDHLDSTARAVMQSLAVYGLPVDEMAINYLLQPYGVDQAVTAALGRLSHRRLIAREDGGKLYYLPTPDDRRVLDTIPRRASGAGADPPFTQQALLRRAASYFALQHKDEVRTVDDLAAELSEIDLLIRAGEFGMALRLVEAVDDYLSRWGYSQVLTRQRKRLKGKLRDDWLELVNVSALGRAYAGRNDPAEAKEHYQQALTIAQGLGRVDSQKRLYVGLADVLMDLGETAKAFDNYTRALAIAREHGKRDEEVTPLSGLASCHRRWGRFDDALACAEKALEIARIEGMEELEISLLVNMGRRHGELDRMSLAYQFLDEGLQLARRIGSQRLVGKLQNATAELLIDQCRLGRAIDAGTEAAEIGRELRDPALLREANLTLALAHLCCRDLERARSAIEISSGYRRRRQALIVPALHGLILLQMQEDWQAGQLFEQLRGEAEERRDDDERDFAALDLEGLAICGQAMCGEEPQLDEAVRAFCAARKIARPAGLTRRLTRLLYELEAARSAGYLRIAIRAAAGELPERRTHRSRARNSSVSPAADAGGGSVSRSS